MESNLSAHQAAAAYTPVVHSHIQQQQLPALPSIRKRVLPVEDITNSYHHIHPKIEILESQRQYPIYKHSHHIRKRSRLNTAKVATSQSFPWEDLVAYHQYRSKQRRENVNEGESVWDDEAEAAFMDGLREVPRLGRRKVTVKGKPCGRNELIAAYIYRRTGKHRTRKQVSSHIQVLKNLLKNNTEFMALVSVDEQSSSWDIEEMGSDTTRSRQSISTHGSQTSGSPNYQMTSEAYTTFLAHDITVPRQDQIKPTNFSMWVASTSEAGEIADCLHQYTRLSEEDHNTLFAPLPLTSLRSWETRFPYVETLCRQGSINTPIIHIGATIETMDTLPSRSSIFCTQLEVNMREDLYPNHTFECVTRIYIASKKVFKLVSPLAATRMEDNTQRLLLPFASEFWAAFFTNLVMNSSDRDAALQYGNDTADNSQLRQPTAKETIMGLTVIQELVAVYPNLANPETKPRKERAALFLWEFSKAEGNEPGHAIWRDIFMPTSSIQRNTLPPSHFEPISEYQSMPCTTPTIEQWHNPYDNYEPHSAVSEKMPPNNLQYITEVNLAQPATAIQPRAYNLSAQDIQLQYLQAYQPYPGLSFSSTTTTSDSSEYAQPWQSFQVLSAADTQPVNERLETLI